MKNSKKSNYTPVLIVVLVGLAIVAYKMMFAPASEELLVVDDVAVSRVEIILRQVESINFDSSIISDQKFNSLQSIEVPMISLPVGKRNPFSGSFGSN